MDQNKYYSEFALKYRDEILNSVDPSLWTTDLNTNGPISARMKVRIETLKRTVKEHFSKEFPVFDIGCGFGRQAFVLAKEGFQITGTDTNKDFIELALDIFRKHSLGGEFHCSQNGEILSVEKFRQVVLLEVLEHIPAVKRKKFISSVRDICFRGSKIIISVPRIRPGFKSWLLNVSKYLLSSFFKNDEHPYPVPGENEIKRVLGKYFFIIARVVNIETAFYICEAL
jgi:2-polyprenyl-3-methyl-5-hydroxy-6-metoxy-1,4-benzoquinol methylase